MKPATVTRNFAKCALAALVAVSCHSQVMDQAPQIPGPVSSSVAQSAVFELDEGLVALLENPTKAEDRQELLQSLGVIELKRVFPDAGEFEPRSREMGLHRFYTARLAKGQPATKAAWEEMPGVLSVELSRPIRKSGTGFNDPFFSSQWDLATDVAQADIRVREVWERYTTGNPKVIVSVVDECVDPTHPDIKFWRDTEGHTGYNFARDSWDLSIRPIYDGDESVGDSGHGTHVAGTIGAINNNGKMVAGMAGGDAAAGKEGVRIMSCAIFSGELGSSESQTAAAIKWGADHGAVISQNSWGYYADVDGDGKISDQEKENYYAMKIPAFLKKAVDYFMAYAGCDADGNQLPDAPMKGGLVVFAAGNENLDYDPVGTYDPVIEVGAFTETGAKANYSNWGDWVDIAAPGGGASRSSSVLSTVPLVFKQEGVGGMVGTSMACPHVSGAIALLVSYFGGKGFTADDCRKLLFDGLGNTVGGKNPVGRKLDVYASFRKALPNHPPQLAREIDNVVVQGMQMRGLVNLDNYFTDPDRDVLSYSAQTSDRNCVSASVSGDALNLYPSGYGICRVSVTASDAFGGEVSTSFQVAVIDPNVPVHVTPEVVSAQAQVHIGTQKATAVFLKLFSPSGALVLEKQCTASVFEPIGLDVSKMAPGRYTLQVEYDGQAYQVPLVKY